MNCPPVKLTLNKNKNINPLNHVHPFDTPFYLRKSWEKELREALEGEILVPNTNPSQWASRAFPVQKSDPSKVRIVADFRELNKALVRPHWPTKSSNQLLHHIDPKARSFCTIDACSGYHQVRLCPESQDLCTIITQEGRLSYTVTPQGVCSSSDLWNLLTEHYKIWTTG